MPVNGTIVDNSNPGTLFQLQGYGGPGSTTNNNVLQVLNGSPLTLALTNPGKFQSVAVLENSGLANLTYTATLSFSGGATYTTSPLTSVLYTSNATPNVIVPGRIRLSSNTFSTAAAIYENDIAIPVADQGLTLQSITFTPDATATGSNFLNVFAVSGTAVGATAGYNQTASVTASSTIDVTGTASAGLVGSVTIGNATAAPITLSVTGGSTAAGAAYTLALGTGSTVSLTGSNTQYVFDVANNGAGTGSLVLGSLSDGGTARNILVQNAGVVTLPFAGSLVAGSTIAVGGGASGGKLRVTNTSGSATGSAPVNVNS